MNISNQKKIGTFVNYWTEAGERSRKANNDIKIVKIVTYTNRKGIAKELVKTKYPTMYDVSISTKKHSIEKLPSKSKEERLKEIPFSKFHNKLVNSLFGKEDRIRNQQYSKLVHDAKIDKMILEKQIRDSEKRQGQLRNKPNLLVIRRLDSKHKPYNFSVNSSGKKLEELKEDADLLISSMKGKIDYLHSAEVWQREEYLRRFTDGKAFYKAVA